MRYITIYCLILLSTALFTSCEKVIDVNLKGAEAKYMIEGTLTDSVGDCSVLITQTKNFDEDNNFAGVSGAEVSITDNSTGTVTTLTETAPGVYEAPSLTGNYGKTYTMKVKIGDKVFTASSSMPKQLSMDTVYVSDENMFGEIWKLANIEFQDPAGIDNYYRFIQHINGIKTKQLFIRDDGLVNGKLFSTKLYMNPDMEDKDKIKSGDKVKIEMQCIDAEVYKYWFSLEQGATGDGVAVPANPVSNIQGGALGYFSAYTTQWQEITAP